MSVVRIQTNDKEDVKISIINNVDIRITGLDLGKSVNVNAIMKHDEQFIKSADITIAGEEYEQWGSDDAYLENIVLQKLGLSRKDEPEVVVNPLNENVPEIVNEPVSGFVEPDESNAGEGLPL